MELLSTKATYLMCGIIIKTTASKSAIEGKIYGKMKSTILFLVTMVLMTLAESASFSYKQQDQWPGICVRDNTGRRSPINIDTRKVKERKLAPLSSIQLSLGMLKESLKTLAKMSSLLLKNLSMPSSKRPLENTS